jgi:AcrR family transcriptional regulator
LIPFFSADKLNHGGQMASTKPEQDGRADILRTAEILISRHGIDDPSLLDIAK